MPSDAGILDRDRLRGIVTVRGGKYSHGAILARSLGIPSVVAVSDVLVKAQNGSTVILDGESGVLILDPDQKDLSRFKNLIRESESVEHRVFEVRFAPAATRDGTKVRLMANVEGDRDLDHVEREVVSGIGLFRTEFAFMERNQFPTEDEQVVMYKRAIDRADGDRENPFTGKIDMNFFQFIPDLLSGASGDERVHGLLGSDHFLRFGPGASFH